MCLIPQGPNQGRLVPRLSVGGVSSRPATPNVGKLEGNGLYGQ